MNAAEPSTTSIVSASGAEAITTELDVKPLIQIYGGASLEDIYDVETTCEELKRGDWKRICLQFPDELLHDSVSVFKAVRRRLSDSTELYVMADTTYGSCCVDEVAAQHVDAQVVVHYGHACLTAPAKIPVLYVFPKLPIDIQHVVESTSAFIKSAEGREALADRKTLVLLSDIVYYWKLDEIYEQLKRQLHSDYTLVNSHIDTKAYLHTGGNSAQGIHQQKGTSTTQPRDSAVTPNPSAVSDMVTPLPISADMSKGLSSRSRSRPHAPKAHAKAPVAPVALVQGFCCAPHASGKDGPRICGCQPGDAIAGCSANTGQSVPLQIRKKTKVPKVSEALEADPPIALVQGFCRTPQAQSGDGPQICGCKAEDSIEGCSANSGATMTLKSRRSRPAKADNIKDKMHKAKDPVPGPVALAQGFCCQPHAPDGQSICGCQASDKIPGCTAHVETLKTTKIRQQPPDPQPAPAEKRKASCRTYSLPSGQSLAQDCAIIYIGGESLALNNLLLSNASVPVISYGPAGEHSTRLESSKTNKMLMRRYGIIQRARDADVLGIVVGTLGAASFLATLTYLRKLLKKHKKKAYTMAVGKLTPAKLANFLEVEAWVLVACSENSLVQGHKDFSKPIITPWELEIALGERDWPSSQENNNTQYTLDFEKVLSNAVDQKSEIRKQETPDSGADDPEGPIFSTVTGQYRYRKTYSAKQDVADQHNLAEKVTTLAIRNKEMAVSTALAAAGAEYMATRVYRGLDPRYGEDAPAALEIGRSGIASQYGGDVDASAASKGTSTA